MRAIAAGLRALADDIDARRLPAPDSVMVIRVERRADGTAERTALDAFHAGRKNTGPWAALRGAADVRQPYPDDDPLLLTEEDPQ